MATGVDRNLELALVAALKAGEAIMGYYRKGLAADLKTDGSPITAADRSAHQIISSQLEKTGHPVVSEEGADLQLEAATYWLVDPLDGTKDFLAANDEFTVNVALVEDARPVLGVVYAPALDELYAGGVGAGAWRVSRGKREPCVPAPKSSRPRMAISRFHDHPDVQAFADANGIGDRVAIGSALKYGRLAAGSVDVFPRLVGSSEWDTAAGQAVLEAAQGCVLDWGTRKPLRYGKPRRRNPRLLALRAPYESSEFVMTSFNQDLT